MTTTMLILSLVYAVLQVGDGYLTFKALSRPGTRELNPLMAWFMRKVGMLPGLIVTKLAAIAVIFYFLDGTPVEVTVVVVLNLIYAAVIVRNLKVYRRATQLDKQ